MAKTTIHELTKIVATKHKLEQKNVKLFIAKMFDVISDGLDAEKQVKVKGLGTFKVTSVKQRESVNVNTGERMKIEGHDKVVFTPDTTMKEIVNKPFAQFETVMLNDDVDFPTGQGQETDETDALIEPAQTVEPQVQKDESQVQKDEPQVQKDEPQVQTVEPQVQTVEPQVLSEPQQAQTDEPQPVSETTEEETVADEPQATDTPAPVARLAAVKPEQVVEPKETEGGQEPEENESAEQEIVLPNEQEIALPSEPDTVVTSEPEAVSIHVPEPEAPIESEITGIHVSEPEKPSVAPEAVSASRATLAQSAETNERDTPRQKQVSYQTVCLSTIAAGLLCLFLGYLWGHHASTVKETPGDATKELVQQADTTRTDSITQAAQLTENEKQEDEAAYYARLNQDDRVKHGAYEIVGVDTIITLRKGQTMQSVCNATLGSLMVCYFQVLNDTSEMGEGDRLKIPKVRVKKKKNK